jgi:uncharacterized protein (TIGR03437 family)
VSAGKLQLAGGGANAFHRLSAVSGGGAVSGNLVASNSGGQTLQYSARVIAGTGGNWLTVSPQSGSIPAGGSVALQFGADPSVAGVGTWSSSIEVDNQADTTQSLRATVVFTVSAPNPSILLSLPGLQFETVAGGGAAPSQSFLIFNVNGGPMDWQAQAATVPAGSCWLKLPGNTQGTAIGNETPGSVQVSIDPSCLTTPGQYYGQVQVSSSSDANNSPQTVTVVANVKAANEPLSPFPTPAGLVFINGGAAQQVQVFNPSVQTLTYTSTAVAEDGTAAGWVTVDQGAGSIGLGETVNLNVQVQVAGLKAGANRGQLLLAFDDGSVAAIGVLAIVPGAAQPATAMVHRNGAKPADASSCQAIELDPQFISPAAGAQLTAVLPVTVTVKIADNCGNLWSQGTAEVKFSDSLGGSVAPPLLLNPTGDGQWTASWTPPAGIGPAVTLTVAAVTPLIASGAGVLTTTKDPPSLPVVIVSNSQPAPPQVAAVANAASFQNTGAVAPGSFVTLFGRGLATGEGFNSLPFRSSLNGTHITLDGQALPLSFAYQDPTGQKSDQVNALVPWKLEANVEHQLIVQRDNTVSVGVPVAVTAFNPGIFVVDQANNYGAVLLATDGAIPVPVGDIPGRVTRPGKKGEWVEIYCTGLGAVSQQLKDGYGAPLAPPFATTLTQPQVTFGGVAAAGMNFSGLAPGYAGLYQVNAQIPENARSGDKVPLVITINNVSSPAVNIAIQ